MVFLRTCSTLKLRSSSQVKCHFKKTVRWQMHVASDCLSLCNTAAPREQPQSMHRPGEMLGGGKGSHHHRGELPLDFPVHFSECRFDLCGPVKGENSICLVHLSLHPLWHFDLCRDQRAPWLSVTVIVLG